MLKRISLFLVPLIFFVFSPFLSPVMASSTWQLNANFDGDGFLYLDPSGGGNDHFYGVAVQTDGKVLVVGYTIVAGDADWLIIRLNVNGSLDTTFGINGVVTYDYMNEDDMAWATAVQGDGKIVVSGEGDNGADYDLVAIRLNSDGSFDNTFGTAGVVSWDSGDEGASDILFTANSAILLIGNSDTKTTVWKYTTAGVLDATFGTAGVFTSTRPGSTEYGYRGSLGSDYSIYIVGTDEIVDGSLMLVWKLQSNGQIDPTFSTDGYDTQVGAGNYTDGVDIKVQGDGKIVAIASSVYGAPTAPGEFREGADYFISNGTTGGSSAWRYNTNGTLDTAFANSGNLYIGTFSASGLEIYNNDIIVTGYEYITGDPPTYYLRIYEYTNNGTLNTNIGQNGEIAFQGNSTIPYFITRASSMGSPSIFITGYGYDAANRDDEGIVWNYILNEDLETTGMNISIYLILGISILAFTALSVSLFRAKKH